MMKSQLRRSSNPSKSAISDREATMVKPASTGLPPKSPSSMTGRILQSTRSVVPRKRNKRRGSRKSKRSDSSTCRDSDDSSSEDLLLSSAQGGNSSSSQRLDQLLPPALKLTPNRSLLDPGPDHMNVAGSADDFFSTYDLNMVSFDSATSPTSVVDPQTVDGNSATEAVTHRRAKSWDGIDGGTFTDGTNPKICLPSIFRRQKVMSADVASVGNASDTLVMVGETGGRISGRHLHERAKAVLNAGDYAQAIIMFEALQKAQIDRFGDCHSSVGAATHNVGVVRLRMGHAKEAEELFERAVAIRRKVLGNGHLDLAASLAKLGSARVALQKFDDGLDVLREALSIARKSLGRSNKTVAQILCHIACLYFEASELFSAQATFEDALEIYREVFPTATDRDACMTQMTETLCNIGSIQNKRKNFSAAIDCFREALDLQRGIMGHDHPRVIATLDNLGYSFSKNKSYNQSLICYNEMLTAQLSHYGSFTTECCETLKKQVLICEKMKTYDTAINAVKTALERVCRETPIPEDSVTYEIEQMLADLKQKKNNRRKAEF